MCELMRHEYFWLGRKNEIHVRTAGRSRTTVSALHDGRIDRRFFLRSTRTPGKSDTVDTDEGDQVIVAIAKTIAELTGRQDGMIRQQLIDS